MWRAVHARDRVNSICTSTWMSILSWQSSKFVPSLEMEKFPPTVDNSVSSRAKFRVPWLESAEDCRCCLQVKLYTKFGEGMLQLNLFSGPWRHQSFHINWLMTGTTDGNNYDSNDVQTSRRNPPPENCAIPSQKSSQQRSSFFGNARDPRWGFEVVQQSQKNEMKKCTSCFRMWVFDLPS